MNCVAIETSEGPSIVPCGSPINTEGQMVPDRFQPIKREITSLKSLTICCQDAQFVNYNDIV